MEEIKLISREQFAGLLLNYEIPFNQRLAMVREQFQLEIPDNIQDGEPFLDFVYTTYINLAEEYQFTKKISYVPRAKKNGDISKKSFIMDTILNSFNTPEKGIKYSDLYKIIDENFEYGAYGKSPRTRIRKVLLELEKKRLIKILVFKDYKFIEVLGK